MNKQEKPTKIRKNYSRHLEEIADEFRFSDSVLESDKEIDDRHLIKDLAVGIGEDTGEVKIKKGKQN